MSVDPALPESHDSGPSAGDSCGLSEEALVANMLAVDAGLRQIEQKFGEHVVLRDEDPVTFGAGHFVLYPVEASTPRFAIEEQYTDTDWSDEDRVPTSWTWISASRSLELGEEYPWVTLAEGEVPTSSYRELLTLAEGWAKTVHNLAAREAVLSTEPISGEASRRDDPGRTFLS